MNIFQMQGTIDLNDTRFSRGLRNAEKRAKNATGNINNGFQNIQKSLQRATKYLKAFIVAFAVRRLAQFTTRLAESNDEIQKTAIRTGTSIKGLQELRFAMGQVGVESSTVETAITRLNLSLAEQTANGEKTREIFENLGIAYQDTTGEMLSGEDIFQNAINKLDEMETSTQRLDFASRVFGQRYAREMIPLIEEGGASIQQLRDRANELGVVIGEDLVNNSADFNDKLDELRRVFYALTTSLLQNVIPALTSFFNFLIDNRGVFESFFEGLRISFVFLAKVVREAIASILEVLAISLRVFANFLRNNSEILASLLYVFNAIFVAIESIVRMAYQKVSAIWENEMFQNAVFKVLELILKRFEHFAKQFVDFIKLVEAVINGDWEQAMTLWKTITMREVDLIKNIILSIKDIGKQIFQIGVDIVEGLIDGMTSKVSGVSAKVEAIGTTIIGTFKKKLWIRSPSRIFRQFGIDTMQGYINGVADKSDDVADEIDKIAQRVRDGWKGVEKENIAGQQGLTPLSLSDEDEGDGDGNGEGEGEREDKKALPIFSGIQGILGSLTGAFGEFGSMVQSIISLDLKGLVSGVLSSITQNEKVQEMMSIFSEALGEVVEALLPLFQNVFEALKPIIPVLQRLFYIIGEVIGEALIILAPAIQAVLEALMPIIQILVFVLRPVLVLLSQVVTVLADVITLVANGIISMINAVIRLFNKVPGVNISTIDRVGVGSQTSSSTGAIATETETTATTSRSRGGSSDIDLFALLSPLQNFNSLVSIVSDIRSILSDNMQLQTAGFSGVNIEQVNITTTGNTSEEIARESIDKIARELAVIQDRNRRYR